MAQPIVWPGKLLKPRNPQVDPVFRSISGGIAVNGFAQVVSSDAGIWKATYDGIWLRSADQVKAWRAVRSHAEGRLNPILLSLCEGTRRPILGTAPDGFEDGIPHSDDTFFDDDTGYVASWTVVETSASAAARAVNLSINKINSAALEVGQRFSIGQRLYEIKKILSQGSALPIGSVSASGNFLTGTYEGSFARESTKYAQSTAGNFTAFPNDTLAITPIGAYIETPATNIATQSNRFNAQTGVNVSPAAIGPDGSGSATSVVEDNSNGLHQPEERNVSVVGGEIYIVSQFVKAGSGTRNLFLRTSGTDTFFSIFDPTNGAWVGGLSGLARGFENIGSGWYRIWFVVQVTSTGTLTISSNLATGSSGVYVGNGANSLLMFGRQVERVPSASFQPSSYIPTTIASVTRPSDNLVLNGTGVNDWTLTFDDNSTQVISSFGNLIVDPSTLNRRYIKSFEAVRTVSVPGPASIKIWPPLREAVDVGAELEFDHPVLRVRLADDAAMDLPLELNRFSTRTVEFLEDV